MLEEAEKIIDYRSEDAGGTSADVAWGGGGNVKGRKMGSKCKRIGKEEESQKLRQIIPRAYRY